MFVGLLMVLCNLANANHIFVVQGASGSGSSWSDATGDLNLALSQAEAGTQIWVAKGIYTPTSSGDRDVSFTVPDGVQVYGGFNGTETDLGQRITKENETILSGEIGKPGIADNSYTVVFFENVTENTIVDGFTVTGGNANGDLEEGNANRCGGAIYINGEKGISKPIIRNCLFTANFGRDGAAVYINGRNGESSPVFEACLFKSNEAGLDGGAIYNDGRMNGRSIPTFTDCTFERNMGTYGGAICNATESGICNLILNNCFFKENAAYLRGGAVFSLNGDEKCYLEMSDCQFENNFPDDQNMIFTSNTARSNAYKIVKSEP